jgi:hypothetical protein
VEKTDKTISNNEKILGLVGTNATSSKDEIATAKISDDRSKIEITSKAAGTAEITVISLTQDKATIKVTVDSKGQIFIDEIVQFVKSSQKAIKIMGLTANQTILLVLTNSKEISSDVNPVATGSGKTYANGTAQISLLDNFGDAWNGSGFFYVSIISDGKIMTSNENIDFTSTVNVIPCQASNFEEVDFNVQTGTLTITNIPADYSHIMVNGFSETAIFIGTSLIGSVPVINGTATIKLFAADSESGELVDFPVADEYIILAVLADAEPFIMIDEEPPATAKTFIGAERFINKNATVNWEMLTDSSGE